MYNSEVLRDRVIYHVIVYTLIPYKVKYIFNNMIHRFELSNIIHNNITWIGNPPPIPVIRGILLIICIYIYIYRLLIYTIVI